MPHNDPLPPLPLRPLREPETIERPLSHDTYGYGRDGHGGLRSFTRPAPKAEMCPRHIGCKEPDPAARGLRIGVGFDGNFHDFPVVDPDPRFSRMGISEASGDDVWEGSGVHGLYEVFKRAKVV